MSFWKRLLAVVVMGLSVALIIACIAGIIGNWVLNKTVTDGTVRVLTGAESALEASDTALRGLDAKLGNARDRITEFEGNVETAGENFVENPVILTALSERLDLGIAPAILDVLDTVRTVREKVIAVQNTIQALNALPFVSIGQNLEEGGKLQRLSEGATALNEGVQETRNGVREAKAAAAGRVMFSIGKGTARLESGLESIQTGVQDLQVRVSETRAQVSRLRSRLPFWLDLASIAITLILLWITFSQVVVFVYGLSTYRNENLFVRWLGPPAEPFLEQSLTEDSASEA